MPVGDGHGPQWRDTEDGGQEPEPLWLIRGQFPDGSVQFGWAARGGPARVGTLHATVDVDEYEVLLDAGEWRRAEPDAEDYFDFAAAGGVVSGALPTARRCIRPCAITSPVDAARGTRSTSTTRCSWRPVGAAADPSAPAAAEPEAEAPADPDPAGPAVVVRALDLRRRGRRDREHRRRAGSRVTTDSNGDASHRNRGALPHHQVWG